MSYLSISGLKTVYLIEEVFAAPNHWEYLPKVLVLFSQNVAY